MKLLVIFGTRPEAIKLAPVIQALRKQSGIKPVVCVTAQQREMLDQLFHDRPVLPCVRQIVSRVVAGELDRELVIRKRLRKGSVDR